MSSIHPRRPRRALLGLVALALAGLAFAAATTAAGAAGQDTGPVGKQHAKQRLVVRGEATVADRQCDAGLCLELTDGSFRGTPVGTGAYTGSLAVRFAELFPNGEGGVCAPVDGNIVLGPAPPTAWSSPSPATPARTAPATSRRRRSPASPSSASSTAPAATPARAATAWRPSPRMPPTATA